MPTRAWAHRSRTSSRLVSVESSHWWQALRMKCSQLRTAICMSSDGWPAGSTPAVMRSCWRCMSSSMIAWISGSADAAPWKIALTPILWSWQ